MLWIGGPPGAGKTTLATRLARRHGLRWYNADWHTWEHRDRALAAGNEAALRWESMSPSERWVNLAPDEMLEMSLHAERGPMVVDDLRRLPSSPMIVAEGSTIPPAVVSWGAAERSRAVWLVPTAEFAGARLDERGLPPGPRQLYLLAATTIEREAREHDVQTLAVDGSRGIEDTVAAVEALFADALAAGPRAESRDEQRLLLREANEATAAQVRGYFARPWAEGNADSVVREFLCECGDAGCHASLRLTVGDASAGPVLAPGHG